MQTDVLIVGAGPAGLMLAVELRRRGVECVVIDRQLSRLARIGGLALNPRSLELLDLVGVLEPCLEQSIKVKGTRLFAGPGRSRYVPFTSSDEDLSLTHSGIRILTQQVLESQLRQRAKELGCEVSYGVSFAGLDQDLNSERAEVTLFTSQGQEVRVNCRFVAGCDGPYSSVRQAAGIDFPGRTLDWIYSIGEFAINWDLPSNEMFEFLGSDHLLVALPLPEPGRYRLTTWEAAPPSPNPDRVEHGPLVSPPTLLDFQDVVNEVVPFPTGITEPDNLHCFRVGRRIAEKFHRGQVCLAGDAAHAFPPATALGMNLGLEDAYVLASKIADGGTQELLESYHNERHEASLRALHQTEEAMIDLSTLVLQDERDDRDAQNVLMERWSPHERFIFESTRA